MNSIYSLIKYSRSVDTHETDMGWNCKSSGFIVNFGEMVDFCESDKMIKINGKKSG